MKVLIATRDSSLSGLFERAISKLGYEGHHVRSGTECLKHARLTSPDLVLASDDLGDLSSQEIFQSLRENSLTSGASLLSVCDGPPSLALGPRTRPASLRLDLEPPAPLQDEVIVIPCSDSELATRLQTVARIRAAEAALEESRKEQDRLRQLADFQQNDLENLKSEILVRLRIEESLTRDQTRLRLLLETTDAIPWEADPTTWEFNYVGPQAVKLLGYPLEDWYDVDFWMSHIHPEDREWAARYCVESSKICEKYDFEYRMISVTGETVWINDLVTVEKRGGIPTLLRGYMIDISQRKRSEQDLVESERRFSALADTAPVLIWMSGTDKLCSYFNQPWLDFTGRTLEQELGNGWYDGVHVDDLSSVANEYSKAFDERTDYRVEYRLRRHDGEYRWIVNTGTPRVAADDSFAGYVGTAVDITELKRSEKLQTGNYRVLERLAQGDPLRSVLDELALTIEKQFGSDSFCSILLLDASGQRLRHGSGPRLPAEYKDAIDGTEIGPSVGSCGTAAYRRERVIVDDITVDPLWSDFRELAGRYGLMSCWSQPIFSRSKRVLGTFAIYGTETRQPSPNELRLVERSAYLAGIAIEHAHDQERLADMSYLLIEAQEEERRRVTLELNKDFTQRLSKLANDIQHLQTQVPENGFGLREKMNELWESTTRLSSAISQMAERIVPSQLSDLGLESALRALCRATSDDHGVRVRFVGRRLPESIPRDMALCLYRVAQEAVRNIATHSGATEARVALTGSPQSVRLVVQDHGVGFDVELARRQRHLGLATLERRVGALSGKLDIRTESDKGTRISAEIPFPVSASA